MLLMQLVFHSSATDPSGSMVRTSDQYPQGFGFKSSWIAFLFHGLMVRTSEQYSQGLGFKFSWIAFLFHGLMVRTSDQYSESPGFKFSWIVFLFYIYFSLFQQKHQSSPAQLVNLFKATLLYMLTKQLKVSYLPMSRYEFEHTDQTTQIIICTIG